MVYRRVADYIFRWLGISLVLGLMGSGLTFVVKTGVEGLSFTDQYSAVPLLGGLLVGFIVYYFDSRAAGLGTNKYISYTKGKQAVRQSVKLMAAKLSATVITLGLIGVGGLVGPLLLLGSLGAVIINQGLSKVSCGLINNQLEYRVLNVCGAAAALGAWLKAPLGGGIFASEVLYQSSLDYNDLFPAILSSSFGYFFYQFLVPTDAGVWTVNFPDFQLLDILLLMGAAVVCGILGQGIIWLFREMINLFSNLPGSKLLRPILAAGTVIILTELINPMALTSVEELAAHNWSFKLLFGLLIYKVISVIIVVASGGSAAVVDMAFFSGAVAGNLLHYLAPQLSLAALVIVGLSATLASIANVPLAAIVLVVEMGSFNSSLPIVIGSIIGFLVGRPQTVFEYIKSK